MGKAQWNKAAPSESVELQVAAVQVGGLDVCIIGVTPLIFNAMSAKVKQGLLIGKGKKTQAEKVSTFKHFPLLEYQTSVYRNRDDRDGVQATRLRFPGGAFRKAMANAALDLPGMNKKQIGRLVWIEDTDVPIWGIPQMLMSVVRSADMNKTPDIRTRAIVPQWATRFRIRFVTPLLKAPAVANLLSSAGLLSGLGDWRQEKGAGNYGQFRLCDPTDKEFQALLKQAGRKAQDTALAGPAFFDEETQELYEWYTQEVARREAMPESRRTKSVDRLNGRRKKEADDASAATE